MSMSNREKTLVILLLIAAILAGGYYLVIKPQMAKMDTLKADQEDYRVQVADVEAKVASLARLRKGVEDLTTRIGVETKEYFPQILTEKLLLVMNDLFIKNGLIVNSSNFTPPKAVNAPASGQVGVTKTAGVLSLIEIRQALQAMSAAPGSVPTPTPTPVVPINPTAVQTSLDSLTGMTVTIDFTAPYESLAGFVAGLESLNRSLAVTSLTSSQMEDGTVSGNVTLVFYSLPKITGEADPYLDWPYTGDYGKPNPFAAPGYDMTVSVAAFTAGKPNVGISVPAVSATGPLLGSTVSKATEVQLVLTQNASGFSCRFLVGTDVYPATGTAVVASANQTLRVLVASSARIDAADVSGINLTVKNTTGRPVLVSVAGDDAVRPRVTFGTNEGNVTIR